MKQRYYSLDVFRGATVALMILVNNPGSWDHIFAPLDHAPWEGCTPTDLVFPFFLFAVGNAMAFVMPRLREAGNSAFFKKVIKRTLLIFFIGLFLNWSPFLMWQQNRLVFKPWEWIGDDGMIHGIRTLGVLQRIALCYFFASLIAYFFKQKTVVFIGVLILLLYWGLAHFLGTPGDPYSLSGYFGTSIDKAIIGDVHMYRGEGVVFDPEGLMSTLPAIVQVLVGFLVGNFILKKGKTFEMVSTLFAAGVIMACIGYLWGLEFPIAKKIWTSSYVIYTSGLALLALSVFIFLLEFKNAKGAWSKFFDVFGKNPLFIFVLSGFLPRLLGIVRISHIGEDGVSGFITPFGWFYEHVCKNIAADPRIGSEFYALCMIAFYWLIVYFMDRKKIYIKV